MKDWLRWQVEFWFSWFPYLLRYGRWEIHKGAYANKPRLWLFTTYYDGPLLSLHVGTWALCADKQNEQDMGILECLADEFRMCKAFKLLAAAFAISGLNWAECFRVHHMAWPMWVAFVFSWWMITALLLSLFTEIIQQKRAEKRDLIKKGAVT